MPEQDLFYVKTQVGLKITVKVTPGASSNQIKGLEHGALKVLVTAVPEDGKANKAVIQLLSKTFKVSKSNISIIQGETSRQKTFMLMGDASEIEKTIIGVLGL